MKSKIINRVRERQARTERKASAKRIAYAWEELGDDHISLVKKTLQPGQIIVTSPPPIKWNRWYQFWK